MNEEIDLFKLLEIFKKNFVKTLIISIILSLIGNISLSYFVNPEYESKGSIIVNIKEDTNELNSTADNSQKETKAINNYAELLKTRSVAEQVIKNLNINLGYKEFEDNVNIDVKSNTQIIEISAVSKDAEIAASIVNELCKVSKDNIDKLEEIESVKILDKAIKDENPKTPSLKKITVLIFALAFIGFNIILLLIYMQDPRIKSEKDLREILDIPYLGSLPERKDRRG